MTKILAIIEQLAATSSRLEKEKILRHHKDNELLQDVFKAALNPGINYYLKKIPDYTTNDTGTMTLFEGMNSLAALELRAVTGHAAIAHLQMILESLHADDAVVIERIIGRNLKCGVDTSTVNDIWPNTIPEWPCMLAAQGKPKKLAKIPWNAIPSPVAQVKMDGMRFNAVCVDGNIEFRSRNGKILEMADALVKEFKFLAESGDFVYDGELWVADASGNPMPRKTGNGHLQKAIKGTFDPKIAPLVHTTLWDRIPYTDFFKGRSHIAYHTRFNDLGAAIEDLDLAGFKTVHLVEQVSVTSLAAAQEVFLKYYEQGQEGIIVKDSNGPWEDKRSDYLVKFKGEEEADLLCIGWEYGDKGKKNEHRTGRIHLQTSDGLCKMWCGSGFTDADRDLPKEAFVGKVIAIKYNAKIIDKKTDEWSLFLPVFVEIRHDKNTADSFEDLV